MGTAPPSQKSYSASERFQCGVHPIRKSGGCRLRIISAGLVSMRSLLLLAYSFKLFFKLRELVFGAFFKINQGIARPFDSMNQFIEFKMNRLRVAVLRVLNQKNHQECDNRRRGIDHKLPSVGKTKCRTENCPGQNNRKRENKRQRPANDF